MSGAPLQGVKAFDFEIPPKEMSERLQRLYPNIAEFDVRLPGKLDKSQASRYMEVRPNGLSATFKTNGRIPNNMECSGIVRSDKYIPDCVGLYYFEVRILNGDREHIGVGLSKRGGDWDRMPGWDSGCFGYHGDDGNFFSASGTGTQYGPKFGTGDVIGCGIDTLLYQVFFTKNGRHLGVAYQGTGPFERLYPTVGMATAGDQLEVNFGQLPFVFDFDGYRQSQYEKKVLELVFAKVIEYNLRTIRLDCNELKEVIKEESF